MTAIGAQTSPAKRDAGKTRRRILSAARKLFCGHGVDGVTMEAIARSAQINKRMVYYYFGSKEDLYLTVLEETYAARREHDSVLQFHHDDPEIGMRRLIRSSFGYCRDNPEYIKLLLAENLNKSNHLKRSNTIRDIHNSLIDSLGKLLEKGRRIGVFRAHADPLQVYLTIASLCFFYHSNNATLSTIFGRDLARADASSQREAHIEDVVLGYLRPRSGQEKTAGP